MLISNNLFAAVSFLNFTENDVANEKREEHSTDWYEKSVGGLPLGGKGVSNKWNYGRALKRIKGRLSN